MVGKTPAAGAIMLIIGLFYSLLAAGDMILLVKVGSMSSLGFAWFVYPHLTASFLCMCLVS
jgi:hypothetical protein